MRNCIRAITGTILALLLCLPALGQHNTITLDMGKNQQAGIYYESYGEGSPIVILHRSSAGYLEPIFSEHENYRRIYLDPPGIGKSPAEDWMQNADDCFEVVYQAINHILPDEKFAVGGFSYFGYMARAVAERNPDRMNGLLMICPVTEPEREKRTLPKHQKTYTDSTFYKSLTKEEQNKLNRLFLRNADTYHALTTYHKRSITLDTGLYNRVKRNNYAISQLSQPAVIEAPVLLLLGLQDKVVGYKDALPLVDRYPSVSLVIADYASHSLPYEQYGLLKQHVKLWLERMEIYRGLLPGQE
ncbi:MAG: alpha/beta hydrolase [Bacteroidales bacterium]|nr:alpha/beta hydrolase [Bacteroidales bacterium]